MADQLMDNSVVDAAIAGSPWRREGSELVRVAKRQGFLGALSLVNAVGFLAEAADHHPDIDIRWDTVTLRLTTHSAGGLTGRDIDLAAAIDRLTGDR